MQQAIANILEHFTGGGLRNLALGFTVAVQIFGVITLAMELSGKTISKNGIRNNGVKWNSSSLAIAAICGAVYIAAKFLQTPQIVPGFGGLTFTHVLAPILAIVFGVPGAVGVSLSVPLSDAIMGYLSLGSIAGTMGHWVGLCWIPMKMIKDPSFQNKKSILEVYFWAVVVACLVHVSSLVAFLDLIKAVPPAVAWTVIAPGSILAHGVIPAILMPVTLPFIFKRIKAQGMYWRDLSSSPKPSPKS